MVALEGLIDCPFLCLLLADVTLDVVVSKRGSLRLYSTHKLVLLPSFLFVIKPIVAALQANNTVGIQSLNDLQTQLAIISQDVL